MADDGSGARLKRANKAHVRARYVEWLLTDDEVRRVHGLGTKHSEFAEKHDTTTRTLRRWREDPAFLELVESTRAKWEGRDMTPSRPPPKTAAERAAFERGALPGTDLYDYLEIKSALKADALGGNPNAVGQWMKLFGEDVMESERRESQSQFPGLDDDGLAAATLALIGPERVSSWLADQVVVA